MEETLLPKFSLLFTLYVTWKVGSGTRCLLVFSGQICMSFLLFVRFCLSVCLFFSLCIFPIPSFGCGLKDLFPAAHKVSKLSISITFWWCHKWKGRGKCMSFTSSWIVNTLMPSWRYVWLDMTVQYHFIHMFCMFSTLYGRRSTPVSTVNILSVVKKFPSWNIANIPTRKPRKEDFRELTVKSKKSPVGVCLQTPLEAFACGTRLGNQSLFILHPCLL